MLFKKVYICVLTAIIFATLIPMETEAQKIELRSAKIYMREQPPQYDKALSLLETALEKAPNSNEVHYLLGLLKYYRGNFAELFKHWEVADFDDLGKKEKNRFKDTLNSIIRSNYQTGQQFYGKGEYKEAADLYKRSVNATSLLQDKLRSTKNKKDAKTADELQASKEQGYLYWGYAALNSEDFDNAMLALEKLLEVDPDKIEAWDGLINIYYTKEDWNKLITACNKVIEFSENTDINTFLILRNAYYGQADTANVINTYEKAIESFPNDKTLYRDLSSIHETRKNYDKAIEALVKGHTALPEDTELLRYLGIRYYNKGLAVREAGNIGAASIAFHSAIESMDKLLVLQPKSIDGNDILSDAYFGLGSIETDEGRKQEFSDKGQEYQKKKLDLITSGEGI